MAVAGLVGDSDLFEDLVRHVEVLVGPVEEAETERSALAAGDCFVK